MKNIVIRQLTLIMIVIASVSHIQAESLINESLMKIVNTNGDETSCAITGNGDFFIFARTPDGKENSDLFFTEFKNGKWSEVKTLSDLNSDSDDISPYISNDGKFILFSSDRAGSLKNNSAKKPSYDIYYSERKGNGWEKPELLFGAVNTTDDEMNPFITKEGDLLYFTRSPFDYRSKTTIIKVSRKNDSWEDVSTDAISKNPVVDIYMFKKSQFGHGSYISGFKNGDISNSELFYTDDSGTKISELNSITAPVNTAGDEISVSEISKDSIIVSTNTAGIAGSFDFVIKKISSEPLKIKNKSIKTKNKFPETLTVKVESENYTPPEGIKLKILFFNSLKKNSWPVKTEIQSPDTSGMISISVNRDIKRVLVLPGSAGIKAFAVEFLTKNHSITTSTIRIEPSVENEFTVKSVYFSFNSSEIQFTDIPYLYELIDYLRQNENVRISLEGYSDGIGSYKSNIDLSIRRAEIVKNYIVKAGIKKNRIKTKGFGYIKKDQKSDTMQFNRRVDTTIISQ